MAKKATKQATKKATKKATAAKTATKTATKTTAKRRKLQVWTAQDHRDLKAHSKAKTPVAKISKLMKRTAGAIRQKALKLGISIGHRR